MAIGFKGEIEDFFTSRGWKVNKETHKTMIFIKDDRTITVSLNFTKKLKKMAKQTEEKTKAYCTCHDKLADYDIVDYSLQYYCSISGEPLDGDYSGQDVYYK